MNSPIAVAQRLDWRAWWLGIWGAAISGGAGSASAALGTMIVAPGDFNLHSGLGNLGEVMFVSFCFPAFVSLMKFLSTHPLPDPVAQIIAAQVETSVKITPTDPNQPITETKSTSPVMAPAPPEAK